MDVVWDDYKSGSLKEQTREKRGKGIRHRVDSQIMGRILEAR